MSNINLEDFLRMAEELGIKYELNSSDPGMFVEDANGHERKVTLEEILNIDTSNDGGPYSDIDQMISVALKSSKNSQRQKTKTEKTFMIFSDFDEVA
ncbi:hypothetical protein [Paenibacillus anseongense]|uniref:hypothetical protein n=1 Tax=Paenibacillus anseongense TaxID=2682845 RepID=UPI002DBA21DC|nr:hypothetical protein [Paenibacillus anseongense]MEC0266722.1 hypothetical protein [Paenibacillus anseongense]